MAHLAGPRYGTVTAAFAVAAAAHGKRDAVREAPGDPSSRKTPTDPFQDDHAVAAISYAALAKRVAQLTVWLQGEGQGVKPGDFVAFCMDAVADRVALQLAVLFVGACYVPIDTRAPDARVAVMLEEACGGLAIAGTDAHAAMLQRTAPTGTRVAHLPASMNADAEVEEAVLLPADADAGVTPDTPAYVMFTSGSTGRPKGVIVPHRGITRLVLDTNYIAIASADVFMHASNPAFDYSTLELFGPLLNGAAMQLIAPDDLLDTARLKKHISVLGITVGCFTTSVFNTHARTDPAVFAALRIAFTSGEVADAGIIRRMILDKGGINSPQVVCNALGHTEATTFSTFHIACDRTKGLVDLGPDTDNLPVGTAIAHSTTRVVKLGTYDNASADATTKSTTDVSHTRGAVGELWVGGHGVALGYLNRPEATARAFITDDVTGERWYRTGDLVRVEDAARGTLAFVGRADNQVKLRGNRIELDEIERALLAHPAVGSAVVFGHGDRTTTASASVPGRVTRLGAYIEFEAAAKCATEGDMPAAIVALREWISASKPPYMVPSLFARVTSMPLGPTGKINRTALRNSAEAALREGSTTGMDFVRPVDNRVLRGERSVTAAFRHAAAFFSGRPAIGSELSYAGLATRVAQLAAWLQAEGQGVKPGDFVAFCMDAVADRVALQLAVLFVGACYVPIDTRAPDARVAVMLEEACGGLAIAGTDAHAAMLQRTAPTGTRVAHLPKPMNAADSRANATVLLPEDANAGVTPDTPAYVMFTSGSTGRPKGVIVPHRGITRLMLEESPIKVERGDVMLAVANPAFDISGWEVWGALLNGARLELAPAATILDTATLRDTLVTRGITAAVMTASVFNTHVRTDRDIFGSLRLLIFGGEAANRAVVERLLSSATPPKRLVNGYGPTEATVMCAAHEIGNAETGVTDLGPDPDNLPIGTAIAHCTARVVELSTSDTASTTRITDVSHTRGAVGELWVGGPGVALGYLNRPEATARAFITDDVTGERWYRTGDLVRVEDAARGTLAFVGRADNQVKLRGNRIELDEIERTLQAHPAINSTVVLAHGTDAAVACPPAPVTRLAAYIVFDDSVSSAPATLRGLRDWLTERLVPAAVPTLFASALCTGLTDTGKIDRTAFKPRACAALARRDAAMLSRDVSKESRGEIDEDENDIVFWSADADEADGDDWDTGRAGSDSSSATLAALVTEVQASWRTVLRLPGQPATRADWFESGGDSLAAALLARRVGRGAVAGDVLQARTPLRLAQRLLDHSKRGADGNVDGDAGAAAVTTEQFDAVCAVKDKVRVPLTAAQRSMVAHEAATRELASRGPALLYHEHLSLDADLVIDPAALRQALRHVTEHRDVLRLRVDVKAGVQWSVPTDELSDTDLLNSVHDLRDMAPELARAFVARASRTMGQRAMRLAAEGCFRTALFLLPEGAFPGGARSRLHLMGHHLALDAVSAFSLIFREIEAAYKGKPDWAVLPASSFCAWTHHVQQPAYLAAHNDIWQRQLVFWRGALRDARPRVSLERVCGADSVSLPAAASAGERGGMLAFDIPETVATGLEHVARAHGVSLFTLLAWSVSALLAQWTQEESVTLMSVASDRHHPVANNVAGYLLNTIVLPFTHVAGESLHGVLQRFGDLSSAVVRNSTVPFARVAAEAAPPGFSEALNVAVVLEPTVASAEKGRSWAYSQREAHPGAAKFDLTLELDRRVGVGFVCRAEHRYSALSVAAVQRFVTALQDFFDAIAGGRWTEAPSKGVGIADDHSNDMTAETTSSAAVTTEKAPVAALWFSRECSIELRAAGVARALQEESALARLRVIDADATLAQARAAMADCSTVFCDTPHEPAVRLLAPKAAVIVMCAADTVSSPSPRALSLYQARAFMLNEETFTDAAHSRATRVATLARDVLRIGAGGGTDVMLIGIERESIQEIDLMLAAASCGAPVVAEPRVDRNVVVVGTLSEIEAYTSSMGVAPSMERQRMLPVGLVVIQWETVTSSNSVTSSTPACIAPARLAALRERVHPGGFVVRASVLSAHVVAVFDVAELDEFLDAPSLAGFGASAIDSPVAGAASAAPALQTFGEGAPCGHVVGAPDVFAARTAIGEMVLVRREGDPEEPLGSSTVLAAAPAEVTARVMHLESESSSPAPSSHEITAETLRSAMATALGTTFRIDDDFYAMGGDSMSAIQVVSAAASHGFALRVSLIARLRTPAALATALAPSLAARSAPTPSQSFPKSQQQQQQQQVENKPEGEDKNEGEVGPIPTSAIHTWLAGLQLTDPNHNDQAFVLAFHNDTELPGVSPAWLRRALAVLVAHHAALRLRVDSEGGMRILAVGSSESQPLVTPAPVPHNHTAAEKSGNGGETACFGPLHATLDPKLGPTVVASVLTQGGGDGSDGRASVWLGVHHIAVDIVSWQVLVADLSSAYEAVAARGDAPWDDAHDATEVARACLPPRTAGPGAWARAQLAYAERAPAVAHAREWEAALAGARVPRLPAGMACARGSAVHRVTARLGTSELRALEHAVVGASEGRVSVMAATLSALAAALDVLQKAPMTPTLIAEPALVWVEGHGRDAEAFMGESAPDAGRAVGWFTAMYPIKLADAARGAAAQQAALTSVPHSGGSFTVLSQLCPETQVREALAAAAGGMPAVLFNFAGKGLAGKKNAERFALTTAAAGAFGGEANKSLAPLVVNCIEDADGELVTWFDYGVEAVTGTGTSTDTDTARALRGRVEAMAEAFRASLIAQAQQERAGIAQTGEGIHPAPMAGKARIGAVIIPPLSPAPAAELLIRLHTPPVPPTPTNVSRSGSHRHGDIALFLVHPAGGQAAAYTVLVDHMARAAGGGRGPVPIPVFGIETTPFRPGVETVQSVAAQYVGVIRAQCPSGPWLVGGWSLGGLLAHEVARQLEAAGGRVLLVAHLDSHHPVLDPKFATFCRSMVTDEPTLLALLWRHVELVSEQRTRTKTKVKTNAKATPAKSLPELSGLSELSEAKPAISLPDLSRFEPEPEIETESAPPAPPTFDEITAWPAAERRARFCHRVVLSGLLSAEVARAFVPRFLRTFFAAIELILGELGDNNRMEGINKEYEKKHPSAVGSVAAPGLFVRASEVTASPFPGFVAAEEEIEVSRARGDLTYGWQPLYSQRGMAVEIVPGSHETFAFDPHAEHCAEALTAHVHRALDRWLLLMHHHTHNDDDDDDDDDDDVASPATSSNSDLWWSES